MKVFLGLLGAVALLAGMQSAWGDVPRQKCTHDMQVQYRKCIESKKPEETCKKEELEAAKTCVAICNPNP
jgi:hypothetical protein